MGHNGGLGVQGIVGCWHVRIARVCICVRARVRPCVRACVRGSYALLMADSGHPLSSRSGPARSRSPVLPTEDPLDGGYPKRIMAVAQTCVDLCECVCWCARARAPACRHILSHPLATATYTHTRTHKNTNTHPPTHPHTHTQTRSHTTTTTFACLLISGFQCRVFLVTLSVRSLVHAADYL